MQLSRISSFLLLASTNAVTKVCWALTLVLLLHRLGPAQFGALATLWSIGTIASGFADLGAGQIALREGSRQPRAARALITQSLFIQTTLSTALACILGLGVWFALPEIPGSGTPRGLLIATGILTPLIDRFQNLFTVCGQIANTFAVYSRLRSIYFITLLVTLGILVAVDATLLVISCTYFAVTVAFTVAMGTGSFRSIPADDGMASPYSMRLLIHHGIAFLAIGVLTLSYGRIEVSLLGSTGFQAYAGAYHAIYQIVLVVYSMSGIFFTVIYPRLYRHRGDPVALTADFHDSVGWMSLLACAASPPLLLFAEPILRLLGGNLIVEYTKFLSVLALMVLVLPVSIALNFLLPMELMRARVGCDLAGLIVTVIGTILAIAANHPFAVAAAAVAGYAVSALLATVILAQRLPNLVVPSIRAFARSAVPAAIAASIVWSLPGQWSLRLMLFFVLLIALLILTSHPAIGRARQWLMHSRSG